MVIVIRKDIYSFLERDVEVLIKNPRNRKCHLNTEIIFQFESASLINGNILLYRGNGRKNEHIASECYQLENGVWKQHSKLNRETCLPLASVVTTKTATYIFGGDRSNRTFEYLPTNSTFWKIGKSKIPFEFTYGNAVSDELGKIIWLIGGLDSDTIRIHTFEIESHTFKESSLRLITGRYLHQSALIPNTNKIIITGGKQRQRGRDGKTLHSTEILDTESGKIIQGSHTILYYIYISRSSF